MIELSSASVLLIGGTGGLGKQLISELVGLVELVHVVGRNKNELKKLKIKYPQIKIHQCDITSSQEVEDLIKTIDNIDVLINSAGIWLEGEVQDNGYKQIEEVIKVNINGAIYCVKAVLPKMIHNNRGVIINISSTSGLYGRIGHAVYASTKYALRGLTESLKNDLSGTKIKVVGVYPGGMKTNIFSNAGNEKDTSNFINPNDVAKTIVFILKNINRVMIDHIVLNRVDK